MALPRPLARIKYRLCHGDGITHARLLSCSSAVGLALPFYPPTAYFDPFSGFFPQFYGTRSGTICFFSILSVLLVVLGSGCLRLATLLFKPRHGGDVGGHRLL